MDPERWRRVRAVVQEAVELPPVDRRRYLDHSCPDPGERREVESLLAEHDRDPAFLEGGAGRLAAELLAPPDRFAPHDTVGAYEVIREIGRGGMGVVYLARDTRLGRDVALKVLSDDELGHDQARRVRLRREARAAAAVSHPGVAQVYTLEEHPDGVTLLVSEHIDGRTLRSEIEDGALPPARAIETAVQVARALAAAHARGVVHRDVKPENVVRARNGTVKVLDFGLAFLEWDSGEARLTQPGTQMGTPAYMAPEQIKGDDAGPPADVYALGLLLYEMLTGRHAFTGSNDSARALMARILDGSPNPLPEGVTREWPGLHAVVMACLSRRPEDRPSSMSALADDLERVLRRAAPPARADTTPVTQVETGWWQLHQLVITGLAIFMIYPAWLNRGAPLPGWAHTFILLAVIAAAALSATLRLHLVFTARVHPAQLRTARRRAHPWMRISDALLEAALLAAAGAAFYRDRVWFAALFITVAASTTMASLLIEPATTEATFGKDD
jgi:serine/threonine protein kinase